MFYNPALILGVVASVFGTACQPLPRPFAPVESRTDNPLVTVKDGIGVAVLDLDGAPLVTSRAVTFALINALLDRNIPAALSTGSRRSAFVYGQAETKPTTGGRLAVELIWHIVDPQARPLGRHRFEATPKLDAWQSAAPAMVAAMAATAADGIAALIRGKDSAAPQSVPGRRSVFLQHIHAPAGLDGTVLRKALGNTLPSEIVRLADRKAAADTVLGATITLGPPIGPRRRLRLAWRLETPDGREIGRLDQSNDVGIAALQANWPALADLIAQALTPEMRLMIVSNTQ